MHYTRNTSSSIGATTSPYILIYIMKKLCSYELRTGESQSHKRRKDNQGITRILMCFQNRCRYYTFSCLLYFFFSFLNPTTANTITSSSSWSLDLSACSNSVKKSNNILDMRECRIMVASVRGRRKKWSESSGVKTTLQCGQNISVHRKNMKNLAGTPPANKKESQTVETERERAKRREIENNLHQIKGYKRPVQTPRWGWKRSWELEEVYEGFPRTSPRKCPPRQTCEIVKWKQNKALRYIFTYIHIYTPQYHISIDSYISIGYYEGIHLSLHQRGSKNMTVLPLLCIPTLSTTSCLLHNIFIHKCIPR